MSFSSEYIFVTCQFGGESFLKEEFARELPLLRSAFIRPGFVTFKHSRGQRFSLDFDLNSVFTRLYGLSLGTCRSEDPIREVLNHAEALTPLLDKKLRLHVWERVEPLPEGETLLGEQNEFARSFELKIRDRAPNLFFDDSIAKKEDFVLDVILLESRQESPVFVGVHRVLQPQMAFPGGIIPVEVPPTAPSRAFSKMEQALMWSGAPIRAGDVALELGSAPGGASYSLLLRGLHVWGVDPGSMHPVVWSDPRCAKKFHHVKKAFSKLDFDELPEKIQWLVLDINAPARVSLPYVEQLAERFQDALCGVLLTLKINDPKHARYIPEWIDRVRNLGCVRVRATQLSSNRQEICVAGLTKKGQLSRQG